MRWQPSLQIHHYESDPLYIKALINSLNFQISKLSWKPDLVLASYHGIPQNILIKAIPIIVTAIKRLDCSPNFKDVEIKQIFNQGLA